MGITKSYDVCMFYAAPYMSGSAYDAFEYYIFLKNLGYNVCCLLMIDTQRDRAINSFVERYELPEGWSDDLIIIPFKSNSIIDIKCNLLISTSTFSMAEIISRPILISFEKSLMFHETTYDTPYVVSSFDGKLSSKLEMIRDDRCFDILKPYNHITYKKKLYFDIFKPLDYDKVENNCLINMSTIHKSKSIDIIKDAIEKFPYEKYFLYTQPKLYSSYKEMNSDIIYVGCSPIRNYLYRFDSFIYFQSNRGQDPSPRIIPECMFYNKNIHFYDYDNSIKDGAYYRFKDCMEDFDSIVLKPGDEILGIINDRI